MESGIQFRYGHEQLRLKQQYLKSLSTSRNIRSYFVYTFKEQSCLAQGLQLDLTGSIRPSTVLLLELCSSPRSNQDDDMDSDSVLETTAIENPASSES
jgi:hypothetical protein